jgi:hypothetical protein
MILVACFVSGVVGMVLGLFLASAAAIGTIRKLEATVAGLAAPKSTAERQKLLDELLEGVPG